VAVSQQSISFLDYSNERSNSRFNVILLTAANYVAWSAALTALYTAIQGITLGTLDKDRRIATVIEYSPVPPADVNAQRERKWLVRYTDNVTGVLYRNELPTADLSLLSGNSDMITVFPAGVLLDFKNAFQAAVVSPDGNAVTLVSLEHVGKRL